MAIDRRDFLRVGVGAAVSAPTIGLAVQALLAARPAAAQLLAQAPGGALTARPDRRDGQVRLALPAGWTYRSFGVTGDPMSDGVETAGRPDGMAAFTGAAGRIRVVRNHETRESGPPMGDATKAYDSNTTGGTTTLEIDPTTRQLIGDWVSLNGTTFNCGGGVTPWGTWLSVEETVNGPDVGPDFAGNGPQHQQRHGFVFEVDPRWGPNAHPKATPICAAGRLPHEACAIDPRTGLLYQTEDQFLFPAGMYRYRATVDPQRSRRLFDGGVLEMMRVRGSTAPAILGGVLGVGDGFDIDWVPIGDPDPTFNPSAPRPNNDAIRHLSEQGFARNAAKFARPEGCWFADGVLWFTCTRGGSADAALNNDPAGEYGDGRGQIWRYDPAAERLTLAFQSTDPAVLDLPDNLTVSPSGAVVICEDGTEGNYIRCLKTDGTLRDIAKNMTERPDEEFAGVCFSPDGRTMFANIQAASGRRSRSGVRTTHRCCRDCRRGTQRAAKPQQSNGGAPAQASAPWDRCLRTASRLSR